ncbi:N/A [soil metagenome]
MKTLSRTRPEAPSPAAAPPGADGVFARELRALLVLAGPIVVSQLGGMGMATTDTILVGPLGPGALAAIGLANAIYMTVSIVCMGTLFGMSPLVSQGFGAGRRLRCRRVLVQGGWLAALLCLPVIAVCLVGERVALALGQEPAVSALAGGYLRALAFGALPFLLLIACRQFLEGMSLTRPVMIITFLGLGVNFVADVVLIYGRGPVPAFGVVGSGWATAVVQWAMFLAAVAYMTLNPRLQPLTGVRRRPRLPLLRRIVAIGAPTGAQLGLEVGFFASCALMMGWFGAVELGTHQVTINLAATTFMVALGVSIAGSIRVGQRIGARDLEGMRAATLATYALALGSMAVFALLFLSVPEQLVRLYTDDPGIVRLGVSLLGMAALFQLFDGAQVAGVSVLRGAADTRVPTAIAALAYWMVGVPLAYLFGFHTTLGPVGIWAGIVVALGVAALLLGWRVRRVLLSRGHLG